MILITNFIFFGFSGLSTHEIEPNYQSNQISTSNLFK